MNKDYGETKIYMLTSYIMWFCLSSILFLLFNIPALFMLLFTQSWNDLKSFGIIGPLMLLTVGPSYTALLYSMGKLFREKEISTIKVFFKGYKLSFVQSLTIWALQELLVIFLIIDINYLNKIGTNKYFVSMWYGLIFLVLMIGVHAYPIIARFSMKTIDVLKLSFVYSIKKILVTIGDIVLIAAVGFLLLKYPTIVIFFGPAVTAYLIMINENSIIKEIEKKINKKIGY